MSKVKSNLIKLFSCLFAVCAAFAIATMPKADVVDAAVSGSEFQVVGTSIRKVDDDNLTGLRFNVSVGDDWIKNKKAEKYSFGVLIAPTETGSNFDKNSKLSVNKEAMDADDIIFSQNQSYTEGFEYSASVVFDKASVAERLEELTGEAPSEALVNQMLERLIKTSFTAVPYAICDGKVSYATPYAVSMYETAAMVYALNDANYNELAMAYLGVNQSASQTAYVSAETENKVVVDSDEDFQINEDTVIFTGAGEFLALGEDYTIDENGQIVLTELKQSATVETVYVVNGNKINTVELTYVDKVLTTAAEVQDYFDADTWESTDERFVEGVATTTLAAVLVNDVDMAGITIKNKNNTVKFGGYFDGRGHLIRNLTIDISKVLGDTNSGLLGKEILQGSVFKNVALYDVTSPNQVRNRGILTSKNRGTVDNIYIKYTASSVPSTVIYGQTSTATYSNCLIEYPYDENFDFETYRTKYIGSYGGAAPFSTYSTDTNWYKDCTNVTVISQTPIGYYSGSAGVDVKYNSSGNISWGDYYVYGENETDVWYDFNYFHATPTPDDPATTVPGLGLGAGEATVQNTKLEDNDTGKTRIKYGVKRYDSIEKALDDNDALVKSIYSYFGLKYDSIIEDTTITADGEEVDGSISLKVNNAVEIGVTYGGVSATEITFAGYDGYATLDGATLTATEVGSFDLTISYVVKGIKHEKVVAVLITAAAEITDDGARDYDASTGAFFDTELNAKKVIGVLVDGAPLVEGDGYTVDDNGYLLTIAGVPYRVNGDNRVFELTVMTEGGTYIFTNVNYWTRIIGNADELKLALDIDYASTETVNGNGIVYNNGYVYNAGLYKIADTTTIDMAGISMAYESRFTINNSDNLTTESGFVGYFDGNGRVIENFTPGRHGLFGALSSYKSGLNVGATIKNVAFTNVTLTGDGSIANPVLFSYTNPDETNEHYIKNLYVTFAQNSADMNGLAYRIYGKVNTNNVYIVSNTVIREVDDTFKPYYRDADNNSIGLVAGKQYYNSLRFGNETKYCYTSTLMVDTRFFVSADEVDKLKNVIIASNAPVANFNDYGYSTYNYRKDATNKTVYFVGGSQWAYNGEHESGTTSAKKRQKAYGYAGNETQGNYPVINGFAKYIAVELTNNSTNYSTFNTSVLHALYACPNCYAGTYGTVCPAGCVDGEGAPLATTQVIKKSKYNNISYVIGSTSKFADTHASPVLYSFIFHDLTNKADQLWSATNSITVFEGVSRYDSVADMKTKNVNYSSFLGESGNGMWNVVEGELVWANL